MWPVFSHERFNITRKSRDHLWCDYIWHDHEPELVKIRQHGASINMKRGFSSENFCTRRSIESRVIRRLVLT